MEHDDRDRVGRPARGNRSGDRRREDDRQFRLGQLARELDGGVEALPSANRFIHDKSLSVELAELSQRWWNTAENF